MSSNRFTLVTDKKSVQLSVTDTGSGIPAEELPHIFDRFYSKKLSAGRSYEGSGFKQFIDKIMHELKLISITGIGLPLVKELVQVASHNCE
jgi:signal transduction histidine kinase